MLNRRLRSTIGLLPLAFVAGLGGCGGSGSNSSGNGMISIALTDSPVDMASQVVVQVSGIAFKREGSAPETVMDLAPSPRSMDAGSPAGP